MALVKDTRNFQHFASERGLEEARRAAVHAFAAIPSAPAFEIEGASGLTGSPRRISAATSPPVEGSLVKDALRQVRQFGTVIGFAAGEPADFSPDPHVYSTSSGVFVVHLHQQHNGIPVYGMARSVSYSSDRRLRSIVGDNAVIASAMPLLPIRSAKEAFLAGAAFLNDHTESAGVDKWGEPLGHAVVDLDGYDPTVLSSFDLPSHPTVIESGPFDAATLLNLVYFPKGADTRLGWRMTVTMPQGGPQYVLVVAADQPDNAEVLYCRSDTQTALGRGNVYVHNPGERDREFVDFPIPLTEYPLDVPMNSPPDFPHDWVSALTAQGNATKATLGHSSQTLEGVWQGSRVVFDPADAEGDEQKILNIFFFCNYMHDFFYVLGFDEASGNFQAVNYSGAGEPGDAVRARAHSGPVWGTANMGTPVDGSAPLMNMGMVSSTGRHTAFDSDVVFHEFTHGVTNRLVGGRFNVDALDAAQSGAIGEGLSDYIALTIPNYFRHNEKVVTGDWVTGLPHGIRGFPYDEAFPDSFGDLGTGRYDEVHNVGEIWCAALMHMNRMVGNELGDLKKGHRICWQAVVDALKLSPADPSFLDMRDAILQAFLDFRDSNRINGAEYALCRRGVWTAFARFGMGPNAQSPSSMLFGIVSDFDTPGEQL